MHLSATAVFNFVKKGSQQLHLSPHVLPRGIRGLSLLSPFKSTPEHPLPPRSHCRTLPCPPRLSPLHPCAGSRLPSHFVRAPPQNPRGTVPSPTLPFWACLRSHRSPPDLWWGRPSTCLPPAPARAGWGKAEACSPSRQRFLFWTPERGFYQRRSSPKGRTRVSPVLLLVTRTRATWPSHASAPWCS